MRWFIYSAVFVIISLNTAVAATNKSHGQNAKLMQRIQSTLTKILPQVISPTLSLEVGDDEKVLKELEKETESLKGYTDQLMKYSLKQKQPSFQFYAEDLQKKAEGLDAALKSKKIRQMGYLAKSMLKDCVACHTKSLGYEKSNARPLKLKFDTVELSYDQKAALSLAVRDFDSAISLYEKALSEEHIKEMNPLLLEGVVIDYLVAMVQVDSSLQRAEKTLSPMPLRLSTPTELRNKLSIWVGDLKSYNSKEDYKNLDNIIKLYNLSAKPNLDGIPVARPVHAVITEHHLDRLFQRLDQLEDNEKSRAFYYYAMSEISLERPMQVTEAVFYLEKSIRVWPKSDYAKRSYDLLEKFAYGKFSGPQGTSVPDHALERLKELKAIAY